MNKGSFSQLQIPGTQYLWRETAQPDSLMFWPGVLNESIYFMEIGIETVLSLTLGGQNIFCLSLGVHGLQVFTLNNSLIVFGIGLRYFQFLIASLYRCRKMSFYFEVHAGFHASSSKFSFRSRQTNGFGYSMCATVAYKSEDRKENVNDDEWKVRREPLCKGLRLGLHKMRAVRVEKWKHRPLSPLRSGFDSQSKRVFMW